MCLSDFRRLLPWAQATAKRLDQLIHLLIVWLFGQRPPVKCLMTPCRECGREVSENAWACPGCGAPQPANAKWNGWGYEYKSPQTLLGLPLIHISFKYRQNRTPVVAKGWLAIGQFSYGFFNISQFGLGPFCISQFAIAGLAISQICMAVVALCQIGIVFTGWGQLLLKLADL
jgi:hypothetical protein